MDVSEGPSGSAEQPASALADQAERAQLAQPALVDRRTVRRAWYVHVFTTSGVVIGMLALEAIFDRKPRAAIFCLLLTQIIDGIDGPMARSLDVRAVVPRLDGYVLDLVIDYVTCVIVPAAFMHRFDVVPKQWTLSLIVAGLVVFLSAMWFSRTDMMTDDNWFNGFPATWNLIIPSLYIMQTSKWLNAAIILIFAVLMLTDAQFPHMMRSVQMRIPTLTISIVWMLILAWGTARSSSTKYVWITVSLLGVFIYFGALSLWRTQSVSRASRLTTSVK